MQYKNFEDHARNILSKDTEVVDTAALLGALDLPVAHQTKRSPVWILLGLGLLLITGVSVMMLWDGPPTEVTTSTTVLNAYKGDAVVATLADLTAKDEGTSADMDGGSYADVDVVAVADIDPQTKEYATKITTTDINVAALAETPMSKARASIIPTDRVVSTVTDEIAAALEPAITKDDLPTTIGRSTEGTMLGTSGATTMTSGQAMRTLMLPPPALGGIDVAGVRSSSTVVLAAPTDKIKCPTFGPKRGKFSFAIIPEIGAMLPNESLEGIPALPASMIRMQDERALEGLQGGLYLKASHSRIPVYLRSGLSYSRISHRLPLSYERVERDTTQGIISLTTSTTGDTITAIIGDIVTETTITGQSTKHYYTHQWDVPVAVGIEQALGRWIVGLEGGVNINVRTTASGSILRTPSEFGPIENSIDLSRRVGLGFFGGVQVGRNIEGFGEVYLAARARSIPDISSTVNVTAQRYMLYGLHAGYVYRF